jgi:U3 small nucleolar ribonucleoprotein protein LCP5
VYCSFLFAVPEIFILFEQGISFLEIKYHLLLSYLINLTHMMLQKLTGNKIEGLVDIDRLVEIRTVG